MIFKLSLAFVYKVLVSYIWSLSINSYNFYDSIKATYTDLSIYIYISRGIYQDTLSTSTPPENQVFLTQSDQTILLWKLESDTCQPDLHFSK